LASLTPAAFNATQSAAHRKGHSLPSLADIKELLGRIDGSLPIRLLLEQTGHKLGSTHHLLTPTYLAKRDGNHGDWIARLDSTRPAKTIVSHMGKDTYAYIHPTQPRTISVREAARVQTFPDWFVFGDTALTDAFQMIGNAVPSMLSNAIAMRVTNIITRSKTGSTQVAFVAQNSRKAAHG